MTGDGLTAFKLAVSARKIHSIPCMDAGCGRQFVFDGGDITEVGKAAFRAGWRYRDGEGALCPGCASPHRPRRKK